MLNDVNSKAMPIIQNPVERVLGLDKRTCPGHLVMTWARPAAFPPD